MVSPWKIRLTWLAYLPTGLVLAYIITVQSITEGFFSFDYYLFLLLAIIVAWFPIRTEETVFSLISGVSLAAFAVFGLIPELFLSTLALIAVIIRSDIKWDQHYRYPLNLLMISFLSIISAGAYYWTENLLGEINVPMSSIIPLLTYMFVHVIANQFFSYITDKYYYRREGASYFNKRLSFSFLTNLFVIPLSFILLYLYAEMGTTGIVIGALPFLMITIGMNYYHVIGSNNSYLTKVNKASQKLSSEMTREAVLKSFINSLLGIFPAEKILYFKVINGKQVVLEYEMNKDKSLEAKNREMVLTDNSILARALDTQSISTYAKAQEWVPAFSFDTDYKAESAIVLPVHILTKNKGIILMVHQKRSIFDEYIISLVEVFYKYFITVLDNAHHYEELEVSNDTDYLTDLPNFRGFSKTLKTVVEKDDFSSFSIIILDLDYFKQVNDIHGHEAGNDVLKQVSDVLKRFSGKNQFIARYGGEEFIIFLKDYGQESAYDFAEALRVAIEKISYRINCSITNNQTANVSVTASMGVATYPNDTDDVYELISLADRVMYTGSKKNGRNRVTAFNRES